MTQIAVKDANGAIIEVEAPLPPNRAPAASSRPVALSNEDKAALDLVASTLTGGASVTKDGGPSWTTVWGVAGVPFTSADQHSAAASVTDVPTTGQKIVVDDLIVSVDTAMSVTLKEETSGTVIAGPFYLPANSGPVQITPRGKGWKLPTANKKLQVISSVAGNVSVLVGYHSEA